MNVVHLEQCTLVRQLFPKLYGAIRIHGNYSMRARILVLPMFGFGSFFNEDLIAHFIGVGPPFQVFFTSCAGVACSVVWNIALVASDTAIH